MSGKFANLDFATYQERDASDAGMFGLLAQLWIVEMDFASLRALATGELGELFREAGGFVPSAIDQGAVDQLASEYCACFLGPKNHLPPYQSVVTSSQFQGECVESMRSYLDIVGPLEGEFARQRMLDHAGVQFKMGQIICEAIRNATSDECEQLADLKTSFCADHLSWICEYCRVAENQSSSQFYKALFRITGAFLEEQFNG